MVGLNYSNPVIPSKVGYIFILFFKAMTNFLKIGYRGFFYFPGTCALVFQLIFLQQSLYPLIHYRLLLALSSIPYPACSFNEEIATATFLNAPQTIDSLIHCNIKMV